MNEYKTLSITCHGDIKIPNPTHATNPYRSRIVGSPEEPLDVVWTANGIVIDGSFFLPYGSFTAEVELPALEPEKAPEEPQKAAEPPEKAPTRVRRAKKRG
jgi:hypothetical protein